ncbi:hypothetical protein HK102_000473 [Quaeritorhiza haematococci]|nr:hypothetical protein HK102_000473 [Quaeritorhiza haematococci]
MRPSNLITLVLAFLLALLAPIISAAPQSSGFARPNGEDAQRQNARKSGFKVGDSCTVGVDSAPDTGMCIGGRDTGLCAGGKIVRTGTCAQGLDCFYLPLVLRRGTTVSCTTNAEKDARIARALGSAAPAPAPATGGNTGGQQKKDDNKGGVKEAEKKKDDGKKKKKDEKKKKKDEKKKKKDEKKKKKDDGKKKKQDDKKNKKHDDGKKKNSHMLQRRRWR